MLAQAQRLGLDDQRAEHPAAARAGSDGELLVGLEADGQELIECRAVLAQHAQRAITGIDECARLADQVSEHDRKGELPLDHQHRLHQPPEFDGIVDLIEWWHALRVLVGVDGRKEGPPEQLSYDRRATRGPGRGKIVAMTIRIFVLDDHELVRTGLQTLLECEEDMEVVGQAATAQLGLEQIAALQPDVAILDVRLPDGSGIEVCREIRSTYPADCVPDVDLVRRR